jgi:hypothetical protein
MSKSQSAYLDLLRIVAALTVLLSHVSRTNLSGGFLWQVQAAGHDGVIVFFVLSGYVISYVADSRERHGADFAMSRLTRLYSVVLPALVLTYVADRVGMAYAPELYRAAHHSDPLLRIASAGLFLSQSWHFDIELFSNTAYWSLPFEFWYYVLFGVFVFIPGKMRYAALAVAAAIAGPKILLLLPVWLLGVASYRARTLPLSQTAAWLLFVLSAAATVAMIFADMSGFSHPHYAGSVGGGESFRSVASGPAPGADGTRDQVCRRNDVFALSLSSSPPLSLRILSCATGQSLCARADTGSDGACGVRGAFASDGTAQRGFEADAVAAAGLADADASGRAVAPRK